MPVIGNPSLPLPSGTTTSLAVGVQDFQASQPTPSATFAGWDSQTEQIPLWAAAGSGGGGGGVTSVSGTTNQIGVILGTTTPVVSLAAPSPAPTPGSYTNANISVDGFGRVTAAANGSAGGGTPGGVVNSIQYNNPLGTFAGSPNLIVTDDGGSVGSKISNATGTNSLTLDRGAAFNNGAKLEAASSSLEVLALTSLTLGGASSLRCCAGASAYGTAGQLLTAVGDTTCVWSAAPAPPPAITSINSQTGPAITLTSASASIVITSPTANTINLETGAFGGVSQIVAGPSGNLTISPGGGTGIVTIDAPFVVTEVNGYSGVVQLIQEPGVVITLGGGGDILIGAPGVATAQAAADAAQATADTALTDAAAAQTTADTAILDAAAASAAAAAADALAVTADATANAALALATTADAAAAAIASSYVSQIVAGTNISVTPSGGTGAVTIAATGVVTAVTGTTNQIAVTSGTTPSVSLAIPSPAPVAGSYTNADITIDNFGRVTAAANGASAGVISLNTEVGVVTLTSANSNIVVGSTGAGNIQLTGVAPAPPPPVIQAAGTTALVPASANTTYILTSGAGAQNFTTAGLGAGDVGLVWYIKNSKAGDNTIQHNGVAITGVTSVLHEKRVDTNTGSQILYWDGTDLIMY